MWIIKTGRLKKYNGMTLWPLLLVSHSCNLKDDHFINHEQIHARQQKELLIVFFYIWYGVEYCLLRVRMKHHEAYRNIVFEKEAYSMESNLEYLRKRRYFGFLKFY